MSGDVLPTLTGRLFGVLLRVLQGCRSFESGLLIWKPVQSSAVPFGNVAEPCSVSERYNCQDGAASAVTPCAGCVFRVMCNAGCGSRRSAGPVYPGFRDGCCSFPAMALSRQTGHRHPVSVPSSGTGSTASRFMHQHASEPRHGIGALQEEQRVSSCAGFMR